MFPNALQNINKTLLDPRFHELVFKEIERRLTRKLRQSEKLATVAHIKKTRPELFVGASVTKAAIALADVSIKLFKHTDTYDIRDYLVREVRNESNTAVPYQPSKPVNLYAGFQDNQTTIDLIIQRFLGQNDISGLKRFIKKNTNLQIGTTYLFLDTRYRILDYNAITKFHWSYFQNYITQQGTTNSITPIKNAIAIKVLPIRIPNHGFLNNGQNRINMYIEEYSTQSVIDNEGGKHHFEFIAQPDGDSIDLTPYKLNKGIFKFNQTLSEINTITLSFGNPIRQMKFFPDRAKATTDYGNPAMITTDIPHGQLTGNLVSFENFRTNDPTVLGDITELMLNDKGVPITYIAPNQFSIPIDLSSLLNLRVYFYRNTSGIVQVGIGSPFINGQDTRFTEEFKGGGTGVGDFVMIEDSYNNLFFSHIDSIYSDSSMKLVDNWLFSNDNQCCIFKSRTVSGILNSSFGSVVITGNAASAFKTDFAVGDYIVGDTFFLGIIDQIIDDKTMFLEMPSEFTVSTSTIFRYKPSMPLAVVGLVFDVIFQNTRFHIPIEVLTMDS
jgi:hypothetical protein